MLDVNNKIGLNQLSRRKSALLSMAIAVIMLLSCPAKRSIEMIVLGTYNVEWSSNSAAKQIKNSTPRHSEIASSTCSTKDKSGLETVDLSALKAGIDMPGIVLLMIAVLGILSVPQGVQRSVTAFSKSVSGIQDIPIYLRHCLLLI